MPADPARRSLILYRLAPTIIFIIIIIIIIIITTSLADEAAALPRRRSLFPRPKDFR
jgi:hypothetical protein